MAETLTLVGEVVPWCTI